VGTSDGDRQSSHTLMPRSGLKIYKIIGGAIGIRPGNFPSPGRTTFADSGQMEVGLRLRRSWHLPL